MSTPSIFSIHAIDLADAGDPITGFDEFRADPQVEKTHWFSHGDVAPSGGGTMHATPQWTTQTRQISRILAAVNQQNLGYDFAGKSVKVECIQHPNAQDRAAANSGTHVIGTIPAANAPYLAWTDLTAQQDDEAMMSLRLSLILRDKSQNLITWVANGNLGQAFAAGDHFTLGPAKLDGAWLTGYFSLSLQSRIELAVHRDSGLTLPTFVGCRRYRPQLRLRTRSTNYLATISGTGQPLTSLEIYLIAKVYGGDVWADNENKHIKMEADKGSVHIEGPNRQGVCDIVIDLYRRTATDPPWEWTLNSAIV